MTATPYGDAAKTYRDLLWRPIPVSGKFPPEKGTTGRDGAVTDNLIKVWRKSRADRNVALRHEGTIAIDVDDYGDKHGADQLALLVDQYGALPASWSSTARGDDSPSRQYLFRVPEGVELKSKPMPAIEICQRHHRYTVVWPSVHPDTGAEYHWYDPQGRPSDYPPHVDELPMLPAAWIDALSTEPRERAASGGPTMSAAKLEHSMPKGKPCSHIKALIDEVHALERDDHVGHDDANRLIFRAYRLGLEGHSGTRKGLRVVIAAAWAYLKMARPREAAAELDSLINGGAERAQAIAVDQRCTDIDESSVLPLNERPRDEAREFPTPTTSPASSSDASPFVDIAAALKGDLTAPVPTAGGIRADGERMLYRAAVNGIVGEPEQGKTLVASAMVADELVKGGSALWVDADHNGAAATVARMRMAGVADDVLTDPARFRLAVPADREALGAVVKAGVASPASVVVIDSVGEVMSMLGAKSNDDGDYTRVHRAVFTPLADAGSAVLVLDHLAKTALSTGYASGTGAKKRAMDGAYYGITAVEAFRPGVGGAAALKILKDRHGGVRAKTASDTAAVFRLDSRAGAMTWEFWPGKSDEQRLSDRDRADVEFVLSLDPLPASRTGVIAAAREATGKGWAKERADAALQAARAHLNSDIHEPIITTKKASTTS